MAMRIGTLALLSLAALVHQPSRAQAPASAADQPPGPVQPEQAKPWLGVAIDTGKDGVLVKDVLPGTPAEKAGLQRDDEILRINAAAVHKPDELINAVLSYGVGHEVLVQYRRGNQRLEKKIKLQARPDELAMLQQKLTGRPAPAFDLPVIGGDLPGSLAKLKGRVVIVEFWATWCPACRSTHARLSALQKQHGPKLAVLAISGEDATTQTAYAKQTRPQFTLLRDASGEVHGAYAVAAIPELVVIDRDGTVAFATIGAGEYLDEAVQVATKLLK